MVPGFSVTMSKDESVYFGFVVQSLRAFIVAEISKLQEERDQKLSNTSNSILFASSAQNLREANFSLGIKCLFKKVVSSLPSLSLCNLATRAVLETMRGYLPCNTTSDKLLQTSFVLQPTQNLLELLVNIQADLCNNIEGTPEEEQANTELRLSVNSDIEFFLQTLLSITDKQQLSNDANFSHNSQSSVDVFVRQAIEQVCTEKASPLLLEYWREMSNKYQMTSCAEFIRKLEVHMFVKSESVKPAVVLSQAQPTEGSYNGLGGSKKARSMNIEFHKVNPGDKMNDELMEYKTSFNKLSELKKVEVKPSQSTNGMASSMKENEQDKLEVGTSGISRRDFLLQNFIKASKKLTDVTPKPSKLKKYKSDLNKAVVDMKSVTSNSNLVTLQNNNRTITRQCLGMKIVTFNPKEKDNAMKKQRSGYLNGWGISRRGNFLDNSMYEGFDDLENSCLQEEFGNNCLLSPHKESTQSGSRWNIIEKDTTSKASVKKGTVSANKENITPVKLEFKDKPLRLSPNGKPFGIFQTNMDHNKELRDSLRKAKEEHLAASKSKQQAESLKTQNQNTIWNSQGDQWMDSGVLAGGTPLKEGLDQLSKTMNSNLKWPKLRF